MDAAGTDWWLGELGRDLHGPMESCCFFLMATTFCATGGEERQRCVRGIVTAIRTKSPAKRDVSPNKMQNIKLSGSFN